jgi:hypothetical protein
MRIYQYHHRVRDRYGQRVLSLAILADESPTWRPSHFEEEILGCRVQFDFPVCKLLDSVERAEAEAVKGKPSAVIVLANWAAQQTQKDPPERFRVKWDLTRRLYEAGFDRKEILELYRLIDWMMFLPVELENAFKQKLQTYEESKVMPYVTSIERMAKAEGQAAGRVEGRVEGAATTIVRLLRRRWNSLPPTIEERIRALSLDQLESLAEALLDFAGPGDLETWMAAH